MSTLYTTHTHPTHTHAHSRTHSHAHTFPPTYLPAPSPSLSHPISTPPEPTPGHIPRLMYRVHRARAQTRYTFSTGFAAKNQTTIVNYETIIARFGLAHLHQQTNISSPFISAYRSAAHAEEVARYFARLYEEDTWVVTIDTEHLGRGPPFRAADILRRAGGEGGGLSAEQRWLHEGEYLFLYRISAQAIRDETPVVRREGRGCGVIGGRR